MDVADLAALCRCTRESPNASATLLLRLPSNHAASTMTSSSSPPNSHVLPKTFGCNLARVHAVKGYKIRTRAQVRSTSNQDEHDDAAGYDVAGSERKTTEISRYERVSNRIGQSATVRWFFLLPAHVPYLGSSIDGWVTESCNTPKVHFFKQ